MEENTVIKVEHLDKMYKLFDKQSYRVRDALGLSRKKLYKEHYALKDVSLSIDKGETVGIIGTNGSGKSTILKIITGVLNQTSGDVIIDGRISALLELGAGFNMEFTGLENIYLNGTMIGFSEEEINEKLQDILDFADIGDFVNQKVKTYSSGMFVRLAFAVAINIDPEILIVDEALSVGDVCVQTKGFRKFEEFRKNGKTILFVSHDLSSIRKYCDKAILLAHGEKVGEGTPAEVIDMYKRVLVGQFEDDDEKAQSAAAAPAVTGEWKKNYVINPSFDGYGDRDAEIVDFAIVDSRGKYTSVLAKGDDFQIKIRIRANRTRSEERRVGKE